MISITFRRPYFVVLMELGYVGYTQASIKTEHLMPALDDTLSCRLHFRGDLDIGNIDLIQFSMEKPISKSFDDNLSRLNINYDIGQNGIQLTDFTGESRYNHRGGRHSIGFVQGRKIKSH